MEPLTLIDARHPATVARWLDTWQGLGKPWGMLVKASSRNAALSVGFTVSGIWETSIFSVPRWGQWTEHEDQAALVAYVVAWARGTL